MRYTDAPARRDELLRRLQNDGYLSIAEVADELGVSEMTLRRDLRQLEADGLARRVPGGAAAPAGRVLPFAERDRRGGAVKGRLAAAVLAYVEASSTVALDAGTTIAPLARMLPAGTTIVSHSEPVVAATAARDDVDLVAIGGDYDRGTRSFTGPLAVAALERLSVDVAVLSAVAIDRDGLLCATSRDAELKPVLARIAHRRVLVAESSKLRARAHLRFARLDLLDQFVTDDDATEAELAPLRDAGVDVVVVARDAATASAPG
ncbi:DeoR/GlpR family DNA-binding transcription regulator [Pseudolysinimonas kribbensis]|uniref:Lactose phosphotransferase system repressor n=1 Tax=Pseudolysinimonas kribbensis TaxID=433641 RepID=A0ABQ6K486_9MICO|nr:DeoR/GlpR family DNA-binding transcription regulator [Pseudolysinimonas kribbensis]GMA94516.1 DeoR family transcriptional regulator [Pseudolysinimonas kribbensis]